MSACLTVLDNLEENIFFLFGFEGRIVGLLVVSVFTSELNLIVSCIANVFEHVRGYHRKQLNTAFLNLLRCQQFRDPFVNKMKIVTNKRSVSANDRREGLISVVYRFLLCSECPKLSVKSLFCHLG